MLEHVLSDWRVSITFCDFVSISSLIDLVNLVQKLEKIKQMEVSFVNPWVLRKIGSSEPKLLRALTSVIVGDNDRDNDHGVEIVRQ